MTRRVAPILLVAVALAGATSVGVRASAAPPVPVLAGTVNVSERFNVPAGMVVVFLPPAGDGFSDGGDGPGGLEWVLSRELPDGFSDGGDVPEGFVARMAQGVGEEFWYGGVVPDGLLPVLAWAPPDGFSDGGDLPEGFVAVLFPSDEDPLRGLGS
jgi:hypothetical protein